MDSEKTSLKLPLLTEFLLDTIIFAMEDQSTFYYLDLVTGEVVSDQDRLLLDWEDEQADEDDRYIEIPDWQPSDGFLVMEKFVNQVRNPLYKERLQAALQAGKGVFRRFKDIVSENPSLEREWFAFKDEHLKREVYSWYHEHDGALQLLDLDIAPEELTDDILQEDFVVGSSNEDLPTSELRALQKALLDEMKGGSEMQRRAFSLIDEDHIALENLKIIYARTREGDMAGFISYKALEEDVVEILFFGNKREYRGMGLFRFLFDHFCRQVARKGVSTIILSLAGEALSLEKLFTPLGSTTITKQIRLSTSLWNAHTPSSEAAFL